jgi:hypothetical protein
MADKKKHNGQRKTSMSKTAMPVSENRTTVN